MTRIRFVLVLSGLVFFLCSASFGEMKLNHDDVLKIEISRPKGQWREVTVPDTLDLTEMAKLAIQGITNITDPTWDYFPYSRAHFSRKPPVLVHDIMSDIYGAQEKFLEALPLLRMMSGSKENLDIERGMVQGIIKHTRDGILWADDLGGKVEYSEWLEKEKGSTTLTIHDGRMAGAAALWYAYTKEAMWKKMAEDKIDAWYSKVKRKGANMMYFPGGAFGHPQYVEGQGWKSNDFDDQPPREDVMIEPSPTGVAYHGWFIMGMVQCYRVLDNAKALEMAEKMTNYVLSRSDLYDQYGHYKTRKELKKQDYMANLYGSHFHIALYGLLGPLEYAILTDNKPLMQYIRGIYEFSRTTGYPPIGYFPEYYDLNDRSESSSIADMIAVAVKLSRAGVGDYWEDVDQYLRNQFVENQLCSSKWVANIPEQYLYEKPVDHNAGETDVRAAERCIGCWSTSAVPNEWMTFDKEHLEKGAPQITQGATGNAARALYYVWESIIQYDDDTAQVNLLLNRASPWMDIHSYLPYEGKVVLKNKTAKNLTLRIPQWVDKQKVEVQIGGKILEPLWANQYLLLSELKPTDIVTVTFPMAERTARFKLDAVEYTVDFKGNTVVHIEPQGVVCPLYQRDYFRKGKTPMKKMAGYVYSQVIGW